MIAALKHFIFKLRRAHSGAGEVRGQGCLTHAHTPHDEILSLKAARLTF